MHRRSLFASLLAFPAAAMARLRKPKRVYPLDQPERIDRELLPDWVKTDAERMSTSFPPGGEILKSFDARDWARAFVAHAQWNPAIPLDEETMTGWFANALMCGYDEHARIVARSAATTGSTTQIIATDLCDIADNIERIHS